MPAFTLSKPVIAAVNGHAIGLGLTLALQCDLRFFAADARYGIVQVRRGVVGDAYSHWVLPRLVGIANAAEILLTGTTFDGHRAVELGLGSRVLDADDVLPAALEVAHDIATNTAPMSVAASKRLLWDSFDLDRAAVGRRETEIHLAVMGHDDARKVCEPTWKTGRPNGRDARSIRLADLDPGGAHVLDRLGCRLGRDAGRQVQQHSGGEARLHGIRGSRSHAVIRRDTDDVDLLDTALP